MSMLRDGFKLLQKHRLAAQSPDDEKQLERATEALLFISSTGQDYRLEDFHKSLGANRPIVHGTEDWEEARLVQEVLSRIRDTTPSPDEKPHLLLIIDAFNYISTTHQRINFEDYIKDFYDNPSQVIACFSTHQEAQAWLDSNPAPPSHAPVLIGNDYHEVWYDRERNRRGLRRDYSLESYIHAYTKDAPPAVKASFNTREEADAWISNHPRQPMSAFVLIAGEYHLAVHFKNIKRRVIYRLADLESYPELLARLAKEPK